MLDRSIIVAAGIQGAWLSAPRDRGAPGSAFSDGESTARTDPRAKRKCAIAGPERHVSPYGLSRSPGKSASDIQVALDLGASLHVDWLP